MNAAALRATAPRETIRYAIGECQLGKALVAHSGAGVCAILLGDEAEQLLADLGRRFPRAELIADQEGLAAVLSAVTRFIAEPQAGWMLPLDVRGTQFQRRVWQALQQIPAGRTATYAEIAARVGQPAAVRAVAGACAANPLALAIPCHRVVRSDGQLSGYRWGVERKRALLEREAEGAVRQAVV
ncbi:MAG: methylated-DNA--[protein]-cysteine S-methyltransferase [Xanthomonadaceae bacterium]|nr:methylated-DNA--[protein]-cysteine S-methyltransferase [Xanthomonadaceae bacterium]